MLKLISNYKIMRIIFMSTSEFGCKILNNLINSNHEIVAIYTKKPTKSGRGLRLNKSPIYKIGHDNNIKVITPENFKNRNDIDYIKSLNADIIIVVSYGLILPEEILNAAKFGSINIHPSILPKYRGAAPIQRSLLNGDNKSAMTIIKMDKNLDSGDIIYQENINISQEDDFVTISNKMSDLAIKLTNKTLANINNIKYKEQNHDLATYAHKISKQECRIYFNQPANVIYNKIRALHGNLGAYIIYDDIIIKIHKAEIINDNSNAKPGTIIDKYFTIKCSDYAIRPLIIQKNGKKATSITDFILGFKPVINKII